MQWNRWALICCVLLFAEPAAALRCGNKLVSDGAPMSKVLKYCGEPEAVQVSTIIRSGLPRRQIRQRLGDSGSLSDTRELLYADRAYVEVVVEEWTYNFGPHRLMRIVRFEGGLVTSVRQIGYGYH
jgi:hypothetical protein